MREESVWQLTAIYRKLENSADFELQRAILQEEIYNPACRNKSAESRSSVQNTLLEWITPKPTKKGRHAEAVQWFLFVVAIRGWAAVFPAHITQKRPTWSVVVSVMCSPVPAQQIPEWWHICQRCRKWGTIWLDIYYRWPHVSVVARTELMIRT